MDMLKKGIAGRHEEVVTHERFIISKEKFQAKANMKLDSALNVFSARIL